MITVTVPTESQSLFDQIEKINTRLRVFDDTLCRFHQRKKPFGIRAEHCRFVSGIIYIEHPQVRSYAIPEVILDDSRLLMEHIKDIQRIDELQKERKLICEFIDGWNVRTAESYLVEKREYLNSLIEKRQISTDEKEIYALGWGIKYWTHETNPVFIAEIEKQIVVKIDRLNHIDHLIHRFESQ